eukprot:Gb_13048 [translate_table: standard]
MTKLDRIPLQATFQGSVWYIPYLNMTIIEWNRGIEANFSSKFPSRLLQRHRGPIPNDPEYSMLGIIKYYLRFISSMHVRHVSQCMQVRCHSESDKCDVFKIYRFMNGSCLELLGMLGTVDPRRSIAIGSNCIWSEFIFLATGRPGTLHGKVMECLINPGYRLGIVIGCSRFVADGAPLLKIYVIGDLCLCMEVAWSYWECLERLILVVALQLAAVAYGVNLFFEPLEKLEACMVKLLECLINPGYRLGIITIYSRFVADGAPLL